MTDDLANQPLCTAPVQDISGAATPQEIDSAATPTTRPGSWQ
jgi:hypothetical protein